ncbi:MAG: hypothetical protein JXB14_03765 [Candidatus Altiarchaeota archaeon]|nr:hypothetical protein [Candidatus Altiarchaeota archaeon]
MNGKTILIPAAVLIILFFAFSQPQNPVKGPYCGDGACNGDETGSSCPADCGSCKIGYCGDGICGDGENCSSCPEDCGACIRPVAICGDGVCNGDESCSSCPSDCGSCQPSGYCGDGTCSDGENCSSCPADCGRPKECKLVMFHNSVGPMCIEMLDYMDSIEGEFPGLLFEQHLTSESGYDSLLSRWKSANPQSLGVSDDYSYLPITFINGRAYSGFNNWVKTRLHADLEGVCG